MYWHTGYTSASTPVHAGMYKDTGYFQFHNNTATNVLEDITEKNENFHGKLLEEFLKGFLNT